ncbi:hypothetical protein BIV60_13765 [Bacillus sp. MUM 116]|uniref:HNH endonuclease n=1 Tax=Bacillus sp. MUM 116 TaxID=1678002 RepID=UPI0008F5BD2E|nr:HNH endonuclease [Bacillus sp. MUM 116]OIK13558.1 hypothetical protein BIV60_13765 [Bacillus sp. MUM 116]
MKNDYEIRGDVVAIFLKRKDGTRMECLVDVKMLPMIHKIPNTLYAWKAKHYKTYYVRFDIGGRSNKKSFYLHKFLFGHTSDKVIDHINGNGLDNRIENLRVIQQYENLQNRRGANYQSKSGVRNVSWCSRVNMWFVQIREKNKRHSIGILKIYLMLKGER